MKPLLILLTVCSSFFASAKSNANPLISEAAIQSFKSAFVTASDVSWTYSNNLYKAYFLLNGQYATAFYHADGAFVGVTRHISALQLPLTLQVALKKDNKSMWISELFEAITEQGVQYFVTLEDADNKLILKSENGTAWSNFKKLRKN